MKIDFKAQPEDIERAEIMSELVKNSLETKYKTQYAELGNRTIEQYEEDKWKVLTSYKKK